VHPTGHPTWLETHAVRRPLAGIMTDSVRLVPLSQARSFLTVPSDAFWVVTTLDRLSNNPAKSDDYENVQEVSLENGEDLEFAIAEASKHKSVTVIIVSDGDEPRFDVEKLAATAAEIDRLGFRPQQAIVIPVEQMAMVRSAPFESLQPGVGAPAMPLETSISTRWLKPQFRRWRFSLRPVLERAQVTRTKPPVRVVEESSLRLSPPKPIHAAAAKWRVHIAGTRGDQPGVVGNDIVTS